MSIIKALINFIMCGCSKVTDAGLAHLSGVTPACVAHALR